MLEIEVSIFCWGKKSLVVGERTASDGSSQLFQSSQEPKSKIWEGLKSWSKSSAGRV